MQSYSRSTKTILKFETALGFTLKEEGGYEEIDTPTNYGITQLTYDKWNRDHGFTPKPVKGIDLATVSRIYREWYWEPCSCDVLPYPLAASTFDAAVNSGQKRAILWLQGGLHVSEDGIIGPDVLDTVSKKDPYTVAYAAITLRKQFVQGANISDRFKRIILGRCDRLWQHIQQSKEEV